MAALPPVMTIPSEIAAPVCETIDRVHAKRDKTDKELPSKAIGARVRKRRELLGDWRPPSFSGSVRRAPLKQTEPERPAGMPAPNDELDLEIDKAIELLRSVPFEELQRRGWHFQPNHYYWPLNDVPFLRRHPEVWVRRSVPAEIDWGIAAQLELLEQIQPHFPEFPDMGNELTPVVGESAPRTSPFSHADAYAYYGIVRKLQPRRLIEVGVGLSSLVMAQAIARNEHPCEVTLVDPEPPWKVLGDLPDDWTVLQEPVQFAEPWLFQELRPGDVLFYDGSHCIRAGSDVNWMFFEVLPRLAPGVWIHVHDLHWPFDYPVQWIVDEGLSWNEQYFVQAFLMGNRFYRVRLSLSLLPVLEPDRTRALFGRRHVGGSLWIEKLSD